MHGDDGVVVAALAGFPLRQATATDAELLAVFAAGGDAEFDGTIQRWHTEFGTEHGFPWGEVEVVIEIVALGVEIWMGGVADSEVEIACFCAAGAGLALAGDPDAFAIRNSCGDADLELVGLNLAGASVRRLQRNRSDGALHDFLKCSKDIALNVAAAPGLAA